MLLGMQKKDCELYIRRTEERSAVLSRISEELRRRNDIDAVKIAANKGNPSSI